MHVLEPDMVLGKDAVDPSGNALGQIVDVGLFSHNRVRYLLVEDKSRRVPIRTVGVDAVEHVSSERVRLRVKG